MKLLILVSHGQFSKGVHKTLEMFVGNRDDVVSIGLNENETAGAFALRVDSLIETYQEYDEYLILADMIGGSPLTTLMNCFQKKNLLNKAVIFGGMNLPMTINAVLMKEDLDLTKANILSEAKKSIKEVKLNNDEDDDI